MQGELRLDSLAEAPDTLRGLTRLRVEGERPDAPDLLLAVLELAPHGRGVRVRLAGVDSRDAAEKLRGRRVFADAAELETLPEGEIYGYEIIGCILRSEDGAQIGTVRDVWRTGAPDVLVVDGTGGQQHLIPAALLRSVDTAAREAVVELLPGLLDPEEAG
jgi:16S rRNA processing protein RimM